MRNTRKKRGLALLLCAAVLAAMLPTAALAEGEPGLTVSGGSETTDYTYENNVLTIKTGAPLTISNADPRTPTADRIVVPDGVTADVTLDGVNIDVSGEDYGCAFAVEAGGEAHITLSGVNTLKSGKYRAGLEVPENTAVTISGTGCLSATGGNFGAGIGGGGGSNGGDGGEITISGGTVTATSVNGAGIGGGGTSSALDGNGGNGGKITISGGTVTAASSNQGAGIGGGRKGKSSNVGGNGGEITISGGTVTATAFHGTGIGGGDGGDGGTVKIFGQGTTVTASSNDYFDVGNTPSDYGGDGSLSVKNGATLKMEHNGTNVDQPEYQNCTVFEWKDGVCMFYDAQGNGKKVCDLWDGSTDKKASDLGVDAGGTIPIRKNGGGTLTIDKDNVTVTSDGKPVSGPIIKVGDGISTLTIHDLDLTARDGQTALSFASDATLTVKGTCTVTGGADSSGQGGHAIYRNGTLTVEVGDASLTAVGGATSATQMGGSGLFADDLTVKVGSGGSLRAVGGNSGGNGGNALRGCSVTVQNDGTVWAEGGKVGEAFDGNGILSTGPVILSGSETTTAQGSSGIVTGGVLTVDGKVTAEGAYAGVCFQAGSGYKLTGGGTLIAAGLEGTRASFGIYAMGYLELAFTGSLTACGGKGTRGHGVDVNSGLTVSAAPKDLEARPGEGTGGYALHYGSLTNSSGDIPDGVFVKNGTKPVVWPAYTVTYEAPDKDGGTVPVDAAYYAENASVKVAGNPGSLTRSGYVFAGWKYAGTTYTEDQTFSMPGEAVILTAQWSAIPSTGGSSSSSTSTTTQKNDDGSTTSTTKKADGSVVETTKWPDGNTQEVTTAEKKQADGSKVKTETVVSKDKDGNVTASASATSDSKTGTVTVPSAVLDKVAKVPGSTLTVELPGAALAFDHAAIQAILAAGGKAPELVIAPVAFKDLPEKAREQLTEATTYGFSVNGGGVDFGEGKVSVTLDYTRKHSDTEIVVYYIDDAGTLTRMPGAEFQDGKVRFETSHWSVYAVVEEVFPFADVTAEDWFYDAVAYVNGSGLMTGTAAATFDPDVSMTRGMFVTVLYRLAGSPQDGGEGGAFTDVPADAYCAAAVDWAAAHGIVNGTGAAAFEPDRTVTRQETAVILANYLQAAGRSLPQVPAPAAFTDGDAVADWAVDAVEAMRATGVFQGVADGRFDPAGTATRAEAAALFQRLAQALGD